jgi:hypothetical protein
VLTSQVDNKKLAKIGLDVIVFTTVPLPLIEGVKQEILQPQVDFWSTAALLRSRLLSVILFSDSCSAYFSLVTSQRVANYHVSVWDRGITPQSHIVDYYLKSEYIGEGLVDDGSQVVSLSGLGVPYDQLVKPWRTLMNNSQPRYEFHGLVFFNYMHLILVTAPFSEYTVEMDEWLVALLQADPQVHVLLLVNGFDLGGRAFPSQWHNRYLQHVRSKLGGDREAQTRLKIMPYLNLEGRLALTKISKAVLDSPHGGTHGVLEALSLGTPVLTCRWNRSHGFARNMLQALKHHLNTSEAEELDGLLFNDSKELSKAMQGILSSSGGIRKYVKKGFKSLSASSSAAASDIAAFVGDELSI